MTRGNPPAGYCTATVARKKLGNISDGKFRTMIGEGEGKIERIIEGIGNQGFYKIADIDAIIRKWDKQAREGSNPDLPGAHFQVATKEDMPEIVELLIKVFGGGNTIEKRNAWLERNPECAFFVRSYGKVRACIFILPLTEEKIEDLFSKERSQSFGVIEIEDIQPYEIGKPVCLFLLSMASDNAGVSRTNRRKWGSPLVRGLFNHVIDLGKRGIPIKSIAARSDLKDGINLLRHIGFTELEPIATNRNFVIDVKQSGLKFAMRYKAALAEWKAQHS